MFDNKKLIEKFGSWVRVQVEFYDFLFETANEVCATCFNQNAVSAVVNNQFSDGEDFYETAVKAIENHFDTFDNAWQGFVEKVFDENYEDVASLIEEAELSASPNTAMAQLFSDCQDVICHSVFLDDKAHLALMGRINVAVAQLSQ